MTPNNRQQNWKADVKVGNSVGSWKQKPNLVEDKGHVRQLEATWKIPGGFMQFGMKDLAKD